jgi:hypothetical protein
MTQSLFYLDNYFFDLIYPFFYFLISSDNESGNYTRLKAQSIVFIFGSGLLS